MDISRREVVSIGGVGLVTALAGCQALPSNNDSTLALWINNYTRAQQECHRNGTHDILYALGEGLGI